MTNRCIVIDFETSGLSPGTHRAIEVAAVAVNNGRILERYQSLINPGKKIDSFIERYTGITNDMLVDAPKSSKVMSELAQFVGKTPLVAHNASFDSRFLNFELIKAGKKPVENMACTLLLSRRLYEKAPNHRLQTLVELHKIKPTGNYHRALADAEMTAHLWMKMKEDIEKRYKLPQASFDFMHMFGKTPKGKLATFALNWSLSQK